MITWEWKSQISADVHKIRKDWQVAPMIDKNGSAVYRPPGAHFLQAYVVEMHFDISHKPLSTEIYRRPKTRRRLCANLRGRNALQHFTKGTLYKKLQETCRVPDGAPRSSTGFYTYRTNPSVCTHTHCLGNESMSFEPHRCKIVVGPDRKSRLLLIINSPTSRNCLRIYTSTPSQRQ